MAAHRCDYERLNEETHLDCFCLIALLVGQNVNKISVLQHFTARTPAHVLHAYFENISSFLILSSTKVFDLSVCSILASMSEGDYLIFLRIGSGSYGEGWIIFCSNNWRTNHCNVGTYLYLTASSKGPRVEIHYRHCRVCYDMTRAYYQSVLFPSINI